MRKGVDTCVGIAGVGTADRSCNWEGVVGSELAAVPAKGGDALLRGNKLVAQANKLAGPCISAARRFELHNRRYSTDIGGHSSVRRALRWNLGDVDADAEGRNSRNFQTRN